MYDNEKKIEIKNNFKGIWDIIKNIYFLPPFVVSIFKCLSQTLVSNHSLENSKIFF